MKTYEESIESAHELVYENHGNIDHVAVLIGVIFEKCPRDVIKDIQNFK